MIRPPLQPFWPTPQPYAGTTLAHPPNIIAAVLVGLAVLTVCTALVMLAVGAALAIDNYEARRRAER